MGLTASEEQASGFSSCFCDTMALGCFWSTPQAWHSFEHPCPQASTKGQGVSYDKSPLIRLMVNSIRGHIAYSTPNTERTQGRNMDASKSTAFWKTDPENTHMKAAIPDQIHRWSINAGHFENTTDESGILSELQSKTGLVNCATRVPCFFTFFYFCSQSLFVQHSLISIHRYSQLRTTKSWYFFFFKNLFFNKCILLFNKHATRLTD